jgi:UTP:GlnB (protein PII) uridylyltransferase
MDPPLARRCVRVAVTPVGDGSWRLDVAVPDEVGLLAHQLALLSERGYDVVDFATVVWPDKQSLSTFRVRADARPAGDALADDIAASIPSPVSPLILRDADVRFDSSSSPWHTVCTIRTDDRGRALLAAAKAFALAQVNVVAARATLIDGAPVEVLELVDRRGGAINQSAQDRVCAILATGTVPSLRRRTGGR